MIHALRNARVLTTPPSARPRPRNPARALQPRARWRRRASLALTLAVLTLAAALLTRSERVRTELPRWSDPHALVVLPEHCPLAGDDALAHARALEQRAASRRARIPFALREAPRAITELAAAERCFGIAHHDDGRARCRKQLHVLMAELQRRYVQARVALLGEVRASPPRCTATSARSIATLDVLLEHASDDAAALRRTLARWKAGCAHEHEERP